MWPLVKNWPLQWKELGRLSAQRQNTSKDMEGRFKLQSVVEPWDKLLVVWDLLPVYTGDLSVFSYNFKQGSLLAGHFCRGTKAKPSQAASVLLVQTDLGASSISSHDGLLGLERSVALCALCASGGAGACLPIQESREQMHFFSLMFINAWCSHCVPEDLRVSFTLFQLSNLFKVHFHLAVWLRCWRAVTERAVCPCFACSAPFCKPAGVLVWPWTWK